MSLSLSRPFPDNSESLSGRAGPSGSWRSRFPVTPGLLLGLTVLTTTLAGSLHYDAFLSASSGGDGISFVQDGLATSFYNGVPFAMALLAILLAHEKGHYLACRYYGIRCSLPYVLPAPPFIPIPGLGILPLNPFGTFGAVIRIRSPFRTQREVFDVGIAGPLAGFAVLLPMLVVGIWLSDSMQLPEDPGQLIYFGEPLVFKAAVWALFDGDAQLLNMHPVGWAAWFGLLATSLNLLPYGQLDGGHLTYSLLGEDWHRIVSRAVPILLAGLCLLSWPVPGYLLFAVILLFMGPAHPPPTHAQPAGPVRMWMGLVALLILILSFIPIPVSVISQGG